MKIFTLGFGFTILIYLTNARKHSNRRKSLTESASTGVFWHVTDLHWDPTYQDDQLGWSCNDQSKPPGGRFGDYACDSPIQLIHSAVSAMKDIQPDPDFLVWTGDDTPHIWNDTILNPEVVNQIIFNQTDVLREYFPDTMVHSALGNHDWSPKSHLPPQYDPRYAEIGEYWKDWLKTEDSQQTFSKGGYYKMQIAGTNLTAVILNTNLYYKSNPLTEHMPDPANQLQWLDDTLSETAAAGNKAVLIAHVPPGMFEKHRDYSWFYPIFNELFLALLTKHQDTIGSIHLGHHHTDTFRVLYYQDQPVTSMFLAPAVAPWETTLDGVMGGKGNNPSVRLVEYDRTTGMVLDIFQYYLNLTRANLENATDWELEYQGTALYSQPDLGTESLHSIAQGLMEDEQLFGKYYRANGVMYDPGETWDRETQAVHYCAATRLRYEEYAQCYAVYSVVSGAGRLDFSTVISVLCVMVARRMMFSL